MSGVKAWLGVSASRWSQLRHGRRELQGAVIPRGLLVTHEVAHLRRRRCAEIVGVCSDPAIAADVHGVIIAANPAAERLLYRSDAALVGEDIRAVFAHGSAVPPLDGTFVDVKIQRAGWEVGEQSVIRITRRDVPAEHTVPPEREAEVERARLEVASRVPGEWRVIARRQRYPKLGGTIEDVRARIVTLDEGPGLFHLYQFATPRITSQISELMHGLEMLPFEPMADNTRGFLSELAPQIANRLMVEGCSIFMFPRPLRYVSRGTAADSMEVMSPRTLLAVGQYGMPEFVASGEMYSATESGNAGLVWKAIAMRTAVIVRDFANDAEAQAQVRLPNYTHVNLNSRFAEFRNVVIVPIALGPDRDAEVFGALRLINCFRTTVDGGYALVEPDAVIAEATEIAKRIALLYRHVVRAAHRDILNFAIRSLTPSADFLGYVRVVTERVRQLLDFDHIAIWRRREADDVFVRAHYAGVNASKLPDMVTTTSHPGQALLAGRTVEVGSSSVVAHAPGTPRVTTVEPNVLNGFEVPIFDATRTARATVGFYDSWALGDATGVYASDLRDLCESLAVLFGVKAPIGGPV